MATQDGLHALSERLDKNIKRGVCSDIAIDSDHFVTVFFMDFRDHVDMICWNVSYFCIAINDVVIDEDYDDMIKAKSKAFELSNKKCPACYDENGVRRKQVNLNLTD